MQEKWGGGRVRRRPRSPPPPPGSGLRSSLPPPSSIYSSPAARLSPPPAPIVFSSSPFASEGGRPSVRQATTTTSPFYFLAFLAASQLSCPISASFALLFRLRLLSLSSSSSFFASLHQLLLGTCQRGGGRVGRFLVFRLTSPCLFLLPPSLLPVWWRVSAFTNGMRRERRGDR